MKYDKKTIAIIVLVVIIISIGGYFGYNEIVKRAYNQGGQDTAILIQDQILQSLQQNGYVSFAYELDNQTQQINLVPYQNNNS